MASLDSLDLLKASFGFCSSINSISNDRSLSTTSRDSNLHMWLKELNLYLPTSMMR
jgi:hypothetical protein